MTPRPGRSEFFTRAAQRYLEQLDEEALTGRVNEAIALIGVDESSQAAATAGRRYLDATKDEW